VRLRWRLAVVAATSLCALPAGSSARAAAPVFGVIDSVRQGDDARTGAARAHDLGAKVVRVVVHWPTVQPRAGVGYDWHAYDDMLGRLKEQGIRPLLLPENAPTWAQDSQDLCLLTVYCPPGTGHVGDYERFVRAMTERYATGPHDVNPVGVEIWNEENISTNWYTAGGPDPDRYAQLLLAGSRAVRAVAHDLPVVLGGLSPSEYVSGSQHVSMEGFLQRLYDLGTGPAFDAIGIHPYPVPKPGEGASAITARFEAAITRLRAVRDRNNDGPKPIWITEIGFNVGFFKVRGPEASSLLLRMYDAAAAMPDVSMFLVFRLRQAANDPGWGLMNEDWSPREGYRGLEARFANATSVPETPASKPSKKKKKKRATKKRPSKAKRHAQVAVKRSSTARYCLPQRTATGSRSCRAQ